MFLFHATMMRRERMRRHGVLPYQAFLNPATADEPE
jgi:hypothetical protein